MMDCTMPWMLLCLWLSSVLPLAAAPLRAGAFAADITPQRWPVRLIGNFEQPFVSRANDPLTARGLVLDDGRTKLALLVVDSCYLPRVLIDGAKARAGKATGIPVSHMLVAATHTHSAPPSKRGDNSTSEEIAYQELLEAQIAAAIVQANRRLEPARIGWVVRQEPDELNNRRWFMKEGTIPPDPFGGTANKVRMNPPAGSPDLIKPAGPIDPGFTVVSIQNGQGKPLAMLANYSLHYVGGVGAGGVSADYFGEFARQIAERLKADTNFVAILSNGTSGDVNNIDFRKQRERLAPFTKIKMVAGRLAESALAAYKGTEFTGSVTLGAAERELPLRYRRPTPEQIAQAKRALAEPDEKKLPQRAKPYAERVLKLAAGPAMADVKVQALRVGDLGIAAIPFEVFTEIGLEIKRKGPFKGAFTIELANGHYGYLPTPEQHELGGYETWMGTNLVEREASRKITAAVLELLGKLAR
jgi:hypothetical protein